MQVTETETDGLKRQFQITVAAQDIETRLERRLSDLSKRVKLPGFRPGKVPLTVLRQRYGASVMGEVLEQTVNDYTQQAMTDRGLRPALKPKVEIVNFDKGKDLEYKVDIEVLPEVTPMDFSALEVERISIEVSEEEVQKALERVLASNRSTKAPETPRPAQAGDVLTLDFAGSLDGTPHDGLKAEGFKLELGSGTFIPGFEDQLTGVNAGESREVSVTFPEDYPAEDVKGKPAVFQVTVKAVEESVTPTLDDDFAKQVGLQSAEELKERIKQQLSAEYGNHARAFLKRKVLDKLAEAHTFAVPPGMVDLEFDAIWQQIERDKAAGQLDPEDQGKSDEELKTEYRAIAERRVRLGLLLSEVGRQQNIDVTSDEINAGVMAEVRRFPGQEQKVLEYFRNTPAAIANVRAPIFEQKVIDWIVTQAKVTDSNVSLEEFNKLAEAATQAQT